MLTVFELLFVICRLICAQDELQKIKTENAQDKMLYTVMILSHALFGCKTRILTYQFQV